jgi:hypothetical protein
MRAITRDPMAARGESVSGGNPERIAPGADEHRAGAPLSCELFRSAGLAAVARAGGGGCGALSADDDRPAGSRGQPALSAAWTT